MSKYLFVCQNESFVKIFADIYNQDKEELGYEATFVPLMPYIGKHLPSAEREISQQWEDSILSEVDNATYDGVVNVCDRDAESVKNFYLTLCKLFGAPETCFTVYTGVVDMESETAVADVLKAFA